ncbi:MAG: hypothetical protein KF819_36990 [Labilithrix sp.]|nr:hypothetical protein [Labilithrix sp.]
MKEPRTTFVRRRIASLPFTTKNRRYVHELLRLETLVARGAPGSFVEAMWLEHLTSSHRLEYHAILRELAPEGYARALREEARTAREDRRLLAEEAEDERRQRTSDRALWTRCGGRPK